MTYVIRVSQPYTGQTVERAYSDIDTALAEVDAWAKTLGGEFSVELRAERAPR